MIVSMDPLEELRSGLFTARAASGEAILAYYRLHEEVVNSRRLVGKLLEVAPELVAATMLEMQLEDDV